MKENHFRAVAHQLLYTILVLFAYASSYGQDDCLECHGEQDLTKIRRSGEEISLYVNPEKFGESTHADFECIVCHSDAEEIPHPELLEKVDCGLCHEDAAEEYQKSIHADAKRNGAVEAPSCIDCHGKHDILSPADPQSRSHPLNLASTCAVCHADPRIVKKFDIPIPNPLEAYRRSVHGVALLSEQNFDAATCVSCHGAHDVRTLGDPESQIFWKTVPETCGKCHEEILKQYKESVHWTSAKKGIRNAPVCTDCHGEHSVTSPQDPKSPVHPLRVSALTCERCHASELITGKYGISESQVATFEDSYHGLAIKGGSLAAANCASCHGIHSILPSSDPHSRVHPANLQATCGSCHRGATQNFAKGPVHLTTSTLPGRVVQYVQRFYLALIVVVIAAMVLHNGADFFRRAKRKISLRVEE